MVGGSAWRAVARRPHLWPTALAVVWSVRRRRWWRRSPFLPLPDSAVIGWRLSTAYGTSSAPLLEHDLVRFLEWRRRWR